MATIATRHRRPRAGVSVSIALIAVLVVLFAVVLTVAVDSNDDVVNRDITTAPPLSYYAGDGLVGGGHDQGVAALKAHTGEFQGEGRMNTSGGLSVNRPMAHYEPSAGEGRIGGNVGLTDVLPSEYRKPLTNDEIMFNEWNDPLGWLAVPEQPAVVSREETRFWEQNVDFGYGDVVETPKTEAVISAEQMRYLEANIYLPGWSEGAKLASDRQRFTQF